MKSKVNHPDILTCLANLDSDEVFTPPEIANKMLDTLPSNIWTDKTVTFLDPFSKSGVFLREITKRLLIGLEREIPNKWERIEHILKNQVFGIATSELTADISRRSLYCGTKANGEHSIVKFDNEQGNILFSEHEHNWENGTQCKHCGANEESYLVDSDLESHAYPFIHKINPKEFFNMKFDVIIGNPPYQMGTNSDSSQAKPIYHLFVEQAMKLNPKYLAMIIPARWFTGGWGLDKFRETMFKDSRIRKIIDYPNAADCFPSVGIMGGVCYFLWDRKPAGDCEITTRIDDTESTMVRPLIEPGLTTFIRYNEAVPIVKKVRKIKDSSFRELVSNSRPFDFKTNFNDFKADSFPESTKIYANQKKKATVGYAKTSLIQKNEAWVNKWKVFVPKTGLVGAFPQQVTGKPILGKPNTCCTETYLVVGTFDTENEARNVMSYMRTRFFRFLVLLNKPTHHASNKVYQLVPTQDFSESWTDEKLYKKYDLSKKDIAYIESMVRPMEATNA